MRVYLYIQRLQMYKKYDNFFKKVNLRKNVDYFKNAYSK